MREQLIRYVDLLFAGAADTDDIKQEILQNTLDRYDDLVSQGKMPEAAYSLAIAGIGDIGEILNPPAQDVPHTPFHNESTVPVWKKVLRAVAIVLCAVSIIPLLLLHRFGMTTLGLCATISIVCIAAVLLILSESDRHLVKTQSKLQKILDSIIFTIGLSIYLIISFASGHWHITWLIIPITGSACGLAKAIIDLKEAI